MKKFLALTISLVMALSLSIASSAATINEKSEQKDGASNIIYNVNPTYSVTIPENVTLGETAEISAEDVVVDRGSQVEVSLTATSAEDNTFTLETQQGAQLAYTVKIGDKTVALNDNVLAVNPETSATGSATLSFTAADPAAFSGEYKGSVTFTVAVKPILIKFSIGDTDYTAEKYMTWSQWVESEYNNNIYTIYGDKIVENVFSNFVYDSQGYVLKSDRIAADGVYEKTL